MEEELGKKMLSWVIGNDTGLSSQTIWAAIMGIEFRSPSIPHDPADFGRCWRLLMQCDKVTKEKALQEVAKRHEIWKPFVQHWQEMEELFITGKGEELYGGFKGARKLPISIVEMNCPFAQSITFRRGRVSRC